MVKQISDPKRADLFKNIFSLIIIHKKVGNTLKN